MAGKRLGKEDDRHLWPEMLRVIREVRPRWVVGENVLGLVNWSGGLVFHEVQTDLESEGYEVQPFVLPAAAVGAPHRRDRVWFVAHSNLRGRCRQKGIREYDLPRSQEEKSDNNIIASSERLEQRGFAKFATDTENAGHEGKSFRGQGKGQPDGCNSKYAPNSNGKGLQGRENNGNIKGKKDEGEQCRNSSGQVLPNWSNFPIESPLRGGDDGLPNQLDGITFSKWRNESIKAYGNAVVPQVVYQIFKTIQEYENKYL
jgi:DNA (cytosine-5)-methyltransferase 1